MFSSKTQEILCNSTLDPIPMTRLSTLSTDWANIWIKREWTSPEGPDPVRSIKRKPACLLFSDIIEKRYADENKLLISATSGNFGIEIGLLSLACGYSFFAVVPALTPEYNLEVMRALGIHVIKTTERNACPREFSVFFVRGYAHEFHHRLVNVEQYNSWLNPLAHSLTTAKEIFESSTGMVDHVVASVGSCGTICGIKQYLMSTGRKVNVVGVQPALHHAVPGTHIVKGKCKWSPENYSPAVLPNESIHVADTVDAYAFTAKLWEMGIPAGPSTGMALAQAYRMVHHEGAIGNIVVISPDSNFKYGDLISERLEILQDQITDRYPELELEGTIEFYIKQLALWAGIKWMIDRVHECYPHAGEGKFFEVRDIEDIVAGHHDVAPRVRTQT